MNHPSSISNQTWARPSERPFLRRAEEWAVRVQTRGVWQLTDFLTPREQVLLQGVTEKLGLVVAMSGGYEFAERRRALVMPDNWYPTEDDFDISVLRVQTVDRAQLSHGSVMGSLLGTGIERRKVGDISVMGEAAYVLACADIVSYLRAEWRQIGRFGADLTAVPRGEVPWSPPPYIHDVISVASIRLDGVIAAACHWSRGQSQEAISKGLVSLNFVECNDSDEAVTEGDLLSIRGFGRVQVYQVVGESKKGRTRIEVGVLKSSDRG